MKLLKVIPFIILILGITTVFAQEISSTFNLSAAWNPWEVYGVSTFSLSLLAFIFLRRPN